MADQANAVRLRPANESQSQVQHELQALLASPFLLPCAAVSCAALTLAQPEARKAGAQSAASMAEGIQTNSRTSCRQGTATVSGQKPAAVSKAARTSDTLSGAVQQIPERLSLDARLNRGWKISNKLAGHFSECQRKLFGLLGVSNRVMLCLAQVQAGDQAAAGSGMVALVQLLATHTSACSAQSLDDIQLQHWPDTQLQLQRMLHLLLPLLLLQYASNTN